MEHKGTTVITSKRLLLRRFVIEDAEAMFHNWASDPDVCRFLTWPPHPGCQCHSSYSSEFGLQAMHSRISINGPLHYRNIRIMSLAVYPLSLRMRNWIWYISAIA